MMTFVQSSAFFIPLVLLTSQVTGFSVGVDEVVKSRAASIPPPPPLSSGEEFQRWIQDQGDSVVKKIMDKIGSPSDTIQQYEAKEVVARVNYKAFKFTEMCALN